MTTPAADRPHCQDPQHCRARGRGVHCWWCNGSEVARIINARPEFAKANAERMRERHAGQVFTKATAACRRQSCIIALYDIGVPKGGEELYRLARRKHFQKKAAIAFAIRNNTQDSQALVPSGPQATGRVFGDAALSLS